MLIFVFVFVLVLVLVEMILVAVVVVVVVVGTGIRTLVLHDQIKRQIAARSAIVPIKLAYISLTIFLCC